MLEKSIFFNELSVGDIELELNEIHKLYESENDKQDLASAAGFTIAYGGFYTILCC